MVCNPAEVQTGCLRNTGLVFLTLGSSVTDFYSRFLHIETDVIGLLDTVVAFCLLAVPSPKENSWYSFLLEAELTPGP
jgi:hypothetical protein